jgi:hypothetical protein
VSLVSVVLMMSLVLKVCIRYAQSAIGIDGIDQGLGPLAFSVLLALSALLETLVSVF